MYEGAIHNMTDDMACCNSMKFCSDNKYVAFNFVNNFITLSQMKNFQYIL